jgi:hypothetical protein
MMRKNTEKIIVRNKKVFKKLKMSFKWFLQDCNFFLQKIKIKINAKNNITSLNQKVRLLYRHFCSVLFVILFKNKNFITLCGLKSWHDIHGMMLLAVRCSKEYPIQYFCCLRSQKCHHMA